MNCNALRILMLSLHGLIRGHDLELGRDADTGGQTTYVLELIRALQRDPQVAQVDLLTRLIDDSRVSPDYAQAEEVLGPGARIVRLPFGPKKYLRKELLWPHLDQLVDRTLVLLRQQEHLPDVIHTHYADAGFVGQKLSIVLGIPHIHTGHSLGRSKRARLLAAGYDDEQGLDRKFNLATRIAVEEGVLTSAARIIASTRQEVSDQYGAYRNHDPRRSVVIPPGIDTRRFFPPAKAAREQEIALLVDRFLTQPDKPLILAICRPDTRKNLRGLITAYGESPELQSAANMVIVTGNRDDIRDLDKAQKEVLEDLLLDIDRYDLWGKVAIPKHHTAEDVPELYRLAVCRRGVFVNPALTEPFGLTLIEAAASGLPFVATADGGPREIVSNCRSGLLIDSLEPGRIADALCKVLADGNAWDQWSENGPPSVKAIYSWEAHVSKYVKEIRTVLRSERKQLRRNAVARCLERMSAVPAARRALIADIDNTLIGDEEGLAELLDWLKEARRSVVFGVATGRSIESASTVLNKHGVPMPDVLITSVGSEIHHGRRLHSDSRWTNHIRHGWRRSALEELFATVPGLKLQARRHQREFKLSYDLLPGAKISVPHLYQRLNDFGVSARLVYSHGAHLDVLPVRASKGYALRYLSVKWALPLDRFLVAGDSGNDEDMLLGDSLGVVVGNHSPELATLRGRERVYFAVGSCARGIVEALEHYSFDAPEGLALLKEKNDQGTDRLHATQSGCSLHADAPILRKRFINPLAI